MPKTAQPFEGVPQMANPHSNLKKCRKCNTYKPIRDFDHKRDRVCHDCRVKANLPVLEQWTVADAVAARLNQPARLSTTWEGAKKLAREHWRLARANKPSKHPPTNKPRLCRNCRNVLPASRFRDDRVRICLRCDGPPLYDPRDFLPPGHPGRNRL